MIYGPWGSAELCTRHGSDNSRICAADSGRRWWPADAYIFQVAANLLKDRARRSKIRAEYAATEVSAHEAGDLTACDQDPERIEAARRSLTAPVARLKELPERTREIFILYRIENVTRQEIARAFALPSAPWRIEIARATAYLAIHRETSR